MKKKVIMFAMTVLLVLGTATTALAHREIKDWSFQMANIGKTFLQESDRTYRYHTGLYGISNPDYTNGGNQACYVICYKGDAATNERWSKTTRREHTYNMNTTGGGFSLKGRRDTDDPVTSVRSYGTFSPDDSH